MSPMWGALHRWIGVLWRRWVSARELERNFFRVDVCAEPTVAGRLICPMGSLAEETEPAAERSWMSAACPL